MSCDKQVFPGSIVCHYLCLTRLKSMEAAKFGALKWRLGKRKKHGEGCMAEESTSSLSERSRYRWPVMVY